MKTAARARKLGLYASACCTHEALFDINDVFSRCPKCERLCSWRLVERVFCGQELNELELEFESEAA